ncbi:protein SUPPRESSOR OF GENE SILENCING 3-like [Phragmites australis]|uniref:protein SUPPRESSOR OF GENE SILENCING 3-like n=1 Tax=Phragmites australis TaxID=29695 RepID=UPI002D775827|nr:protein SUPPRESSOR OF GENE SILENCING 3-like [Phragmites australis]
MKAANPKAKPKPMPPPAAPATHNPLPSPRASSSSSSAADPNPKRTHPNAAAGGSATASTPPNPSPSLNGEANRSPLLPAPHPLLGAPQPLPPPLPPTRPLLTVAAVEAVMAAIPPPPRYGLEDLDRRTVALSDGTVRTYFALPLEPPPQLRQPLPPIPAHLLAPPLGPPLLGPDRWAPPLAPTPAAAAGLLPGPVLKRKWEDHANGGAPWESSGRQQQQQKPGERRDAKQAKVEVPGVDAKALKNAFLKMVKVINESDADKKNLRANGKLFQLKCTVCGRDSIDLHALLNHAYHAKNPEHRADHLGLHKALCVLMGWNYSADPVHKTAYQALSTADAEANQGDLILWPPTVIIENTYKSKNIGGKDGMSNKEMESKLREMGFAGGDVQVQPLLGKDGQRSMQVKFSGSLDGLSKASQLVELFEREGHGRAAWARIRSIVPTADEGNNPMLVKVDGKGMRTWVLYGYLATAWDLDILDPESKQNATVKSRKELDLD